MLKSIDKLPCNIDVKFDVHDVAQSIKNLKCGKSPGLDGLQAEHFKYSDLTLQCLLAMCMNFMVLHGFLPDAAMDSVIVPVIKDKKALLTDKNNYRPVAITSVFSKILESIVLDMYQYLLVTSDNQFGFKFEHSTDLCIFGLKQIIEFYHNLSSPVYVCFLDASKAFDRLNHWVLFKKLIDRGIPLIIVRLFVYWYGNQQFCIRWGNTLSNKFATSNGVRQGGIISPVYFNIYMDGLSNDLKRSKIGCKINGEILNHLLYADDSCIIASSPSALQKLLNICCEYAETNSIIYNELKTKCICFKPSNCKDLSVPALFLKRVQLKFVNSIRYLGVIISNDMTDFEDMMRHRKYMYAKGNILVRKFKECSDSVKLRLFRTYCYNVYGGHLWSKYKTLDFHKLIVAFNDVYRLLFNVKRGVSMSEIYVNSNIDHFKIIVRKASYRFRLRLQKSDNQVVSTIMKSVFFYSYSSLNNMWLRDIFV